MTGFRSKDQEAWIDRMQQQTQVVRCAVCKVWEFEGTSEECRAAFTSHRERFHQGRAEAAALTPQEADAGRDALDRMDVGEPQKPGLGEGERSAAVAASEPPADAAVTDAASAEASHNREERPVEGNHRRGPKPFWNRDNIVAAIKAKAAELGHPPTRRDLAESVPNASVSRVFGTHADAIEAAGFPRPARSKTIYRERSPRPSPAPEPGPDDRGGLHRELALIKQPETVTDVEALMPADALAALTVDQLLEAHRLIRRELRGRREDAERTAARISVELGDEAAA